MSKITALLYMCIYITVTISQPLYPPSWEPYCDVFNSTEFVNITCNLKPEDSEILKLTELNEYTNNTADNVKYSVYWECSPNAKVSMIASMKINKLYSLKVFGCYILNIYDKFPKTKASLVYVEIVDCVIEVDFTKYLNVLDIIEIGFIQNMLLKEMLNNYRNIFHDLTCSHDTTIKQSIYRNISINLRAPTDKQREHLNNFLSVFLTEYRRSRINSNDLPECNFQSLEVFESVMVKSHFHLVILQILFTSVKNEFPNIRVFNFSYNGITMFPQEWQYNLYRFPKLEYIVYSHNLIADISIDSSYRFPKPGRQIVLDLRYNNITTLTAETVSKWTELEDTTLDIRGNPLDCGCFKQDFINTVQDDTFFGGKMKKYRYMYIQNMPCASPATAKGIQIINLSKAEMGCEIPPTDLTIYLVLLGVTAAILILLILLVFKFRKDIKLYLYVKFNILLPCDVDKSAEKKQFDAFISYSSYDSDWVLDNLVQLESPFDSHEALSLCIHERDFICGKSILLNIIDSIENSRHTIVVLSRQFIQSVWSMAEFKEAYEESITKKHRHLIIIKYEDVPETEMDSMLKRSIKTFTYIDVKDPKFIDRLRFSLAIKGR